LRGEDQSRSVVVSKAWIVDDELWKLIEPVLPPWPQKAPGPRPVPDRQCLLALHILHQDRRLTTHYRVVQ
jgi:hypothetical protein